MNCGTWITLIGEDDGYGVLAAALRRNFAQQVIVRRSAAACVERNGFVEHGLHGRVLIGERGDDHERNAGSEC